MTLFDENHMILKKCKVEGKETHRWKDKNRPKKIHDFSFSRKAASFKRDISKRQRKLLLPASTLTMNISTS